MYILYVCVCVYVVATHIFSANLATNMIWNKSKGRGCTVKSKDCISYKNSSCCSSFFFTFSNVINIAYHKGGTFTDLLFFRLQLREAQVIFGAIKELMMANDALWSWFRRMLDLQGVLNLSALKLLSTLKQLQIIKLHSHTIKVSSTNVILPKIVDDVLLDIPCHSAWPILLNKIFLCRPVTW